MLFKENKTFYFISIVAFIIFSMGVIYLDVNSKSFIFISTLSGGIVSACILYFFIEIIPTNKKRKDTFEVLNKTISSILEAYFQKVSFSGVWQCEKSIKYVSTDYLNSIDKINKAITDIKNFNVEYFQLNYSIQTAHSRYNDFQNLLILANSISPKHSLLWLDLIEKVKLMAEEYDNRIKKVRLMSEAYDNKKETLDQEILRDLKQLKNYEDTSNETYQVCTSYQMRVLEFFESVEYWIKENS